MGSTTFDGDRIEGMRACAGAQEVLASPEVDGVELSEAQLESVLGGVATDWTLDQLISSFDEGLGKLIPEGIDPRLVWISVPTFAARSHGRGHVPRSPLPTPSR